MNKTKKSKSYIAIIKYPHNEHLQTIISIGNSMISTDIWHEYHE